MIDLGDVRFATVTAIAPRSRLFPFFEGGIHIDAAFATKSKIGDFGLCKRAGMMQF